MTRTRRTFTAEEKANVVKRHLMDKVPVSDLCDELKIQPTQVYQWQKQLFDNAPAAFQKTRANPNAEQAKDRKILALEDTIRLKNEVVAELLQEHVQLKKAIGEP